jgi:hypothetical protein
MVATCQVKFACLALVTAVGGREQLTHTAIPQQPSSHCLQSARLQKRNSVAFNRKTATTHEEVFSRRTHPDDVYRINGRSSGFISVPDLIDGILPLPEARRRAMQIFDKRST